MYIRESLTLENLQKCDTEALSPFQFTIIGIQHRDIEATLIYKNNTASELKFVEQLEPK